jgi:hypothetical protein
MNAQTIQEMVKSGTYHGYTFEQIEQAFDAVKDPNDWKAPINVWVAGEFVDIAIRAIQFYTATTATAQFDPSTCRWLVQSPGYRMGPAGDH